MIWKIFGINIFDESGGTQMFRKMRLEENMTTNEEAIKMLEEATNGVLAVHGEDGYPYAVPLSFAYAEGKIYFHGTSEYSHKLDAIRKNPQVSFCVVLQDQIIPQKFNTLYRSVIAFGKARILTDANEIDNGIVSIMKKYSRDFMDSGAAYKKAEAGKFLVVEITIEHMTGKAGT
jgi:hypothetical protein